MRIFRFSLALVACAAALFSLTGCLTDEPLTTTPSTNLDTRLLGVFELDEQPDRRASREGDGADEEKKPTQRVAVVPLNRSQYLVYHLDLEKKPPVRTQFTGWISRVDTKYYLTLEDTTPGSPTLGKFTFLRFAWRFPGNIILYAPDLKELDNVTSYQMRQAVRKRLKDDTLFPFEGTYWNKIARIWWNPDAKDQEVGIPKEFEQGTTRKFPGL